MVYSLDLHILYTLPADRDTVLGALPASNDSRVVASLHETPKDTITINGVNVIKGSIRYKTLASLNSVRASLKGLNGTWARSSAGSYLQGHECHNDDNSAPCTTILFKDVI